MQHDNQGNSIYNGHLLAAGQFPPLSADNRAFRYGDGLFESIRILNGRPHLIEEHWQRLCRGMELLKLQPPADWSVDFFGKQIEKLCGTSGQWRARLTVFRSSEGLYTPTSNQCAFWLEAGPLEESEFVFPTKGLEIGICESIQLQQHPLSTIKSLNSLPYVLAGMERRDKGWDDALLLNTAGRVAEACSSNLFIWKGGKLWTPPLSEGCLDGVMRRHLLWLAKQQHIPVDIQPLTVADVLEAEEIFLSNAIQGIKWVKRLNHCIFGPSVSRRLHQYLNQSIK
ncbi:MAG: aminotransferase class IV [Bacteroidota bacterium]